MVELKGFTTFVLILSFLASCLGSWEYGGPSYEPSNSNDKPVIGPNPRFPAGEAWECFVCNSTEDTANTSRPCVNTGYSKPPSQVYRNGNPDSGSDQCQICIKEVSGNVTARRCGKTSDCPRGNQGNETNSWTYEMDANVTMLYCCNVMLCNLATPSSANIWLMLTMIFTSGLYFLNS